VDVFGNSIGGGVDFVVMMINPTLNACQTNLLAPPIVQDKTYVIGDTMLYFNYEFIHPGMDGSMDCYT
jgi:hypothetical protein